MSAGRIASRLYELRTYSLRMDQMRHFLAGTETLFHLRTQHSPLIGYWTAELGGLNQVVHVWEYDDLSHRATVRGKLAADEEWTQKYVTPVLSPALVAQDNFLMRPLDGTTVSMPTDTGVTELQQLELRGPTTFSARSQSIMHASHPSEDFDQQLMEHVRTGHSKLLLPLKVSPIQ
ncbi:protein NipSnap homolog 3A-like [Pollicipes pollicipes]|uniref:protein NipSnap homolog 3A-like n=1 Tax=Pollicipes pollicipes TaxID=41117 RepID=UPI001884D95A|nr:protein NipSnap homolog 3A-like [Pollicipes pollicipes]